MRPTRLELSGFTAFRQPTTVDFTDADLFALAGPTGAGKSSLIDAMCFALYGNVPRLDRRAVAPVISATGNEARIRFDFTVGDDAYTAVRVVRRTATGATTKEARLEHASGTTIAGDADGVSLASGELLGLGFEQFTTCVVLPQGEFARFLHDTPKGRQDLLVRLLELGMYERVRVAARERATEAKVRADTAEARLDDLVDVNEEALQALRTHVERIEQLHAEAADVLPRIAKLDDVRKAAAERRIAVGQQREMLTALQDPGQTEALDREVGNAESSMAQAERTRARAQAERERAEKARESLGDVADLLTLAKDHDRQKALVERLVRGRQVVAERTERLSIATEHLVETSAAMAKAESTLEQLRREHAAHALRRGLAAGDDCPVCGQEFTPLGHDEPPSELMTAEDQLEAAKAAHLSSQQTHQEASAALQTARGLLDEVTEELRTVEDRLDGELTGEEVGRRLAAIRRADETLTATTARERAAIQAEREAGARRDAARAARDHAWTAFDQARDAVAALGPPVAVRNDLTGSWTALLSWRDATDATLMVNVRGAQQEEETAGADADRLRGQLQSRAASAGLETAGRDVGQAVVEALVRARTQHEQMAERLALVGQLHQEAVGHREREAVAGTLTRHLAANGFERWLLDEALERLAFDASGRLEELSAGQYSLDVDGQRNFAVVDHLAADERRSARTLSGGETFLASLALALALADQIAELAVAGTARLESIFLDEGFGTLDPATLDVVAGAIEELGASGRTVGLVTHVRDLADRMPVRFEVRRTPAGAQVERVEQ